MNEPGYTEAQLLENRSPLFLFGGSPDDRRAWAEECASCFEQEGPLLLADSPAALLETLNRARGVAWIPDVLAFSEEQQGRITQCLMRQDERPKLILGLSQPLQVASARIRDDLLFRLRRSHVNLSEPSVRERILKRRAIAAERASRVAARTAAKTAAKAAKKSARR